MSMGPPTVPLGQLIQQRNEWIVIDDLARYKRCRVQLHAQGIVQRDIVEGAQIKTKRQQVCRTGDFLVAEIDAKVGGFGIVPDSLDGAIVSSHYFVFEVNESELDRRYLGYYVKTRGFLDQVKAQGSTNYAAIRPPDVLSYTIPLPPLDEQRRIVARIEELAAKIEEARGLRHLVLAGLRKMLEAQYVKITRGVPRLPFGDVAPLVRRPVVVETSGVYPELGIRSFGKGPFHKPALTGADVGSKKLFRIESGDLLFNIVFAWEGAVAVARSIDHGRVGSHRFLTCVPKKGVATARFLRFHFLTEDGLRSLGEASPGGAGRNRTLGVRALNRIQVPVPPVDTQLWFDQLQDRVELVRGLYSQSDIELDALLSAVLDRAFKGEL